MTHRTAARVLKALSVLVGLIGAVLVSYAGVGWLYVTLQSGITYQQMGEFGASLLFVAFCGWFVSLSILSDGDGGLFSPDDGGENEATLKGVLRDDE